MVDFRAYRVLWLSVELESLAAASVTLLLKLARGERQALFVPAYGASLLALAYLWRWLGGRHLIFHLSHSCVSA